MKKCLRPSTFGIHTRRALRVILAASLAASALPPVSHAQDDERGELSDTQRAALGRLEGQLAEIRFDRTAVPSWLFGALGPTSSDPGRSALEAMRRLADVYRLRGDLDDFEVRRSERDEVGQTHIRLQQRYRGVPVVGGELIVHQIPDTVIGVNGRFVPDLTLDTRPVIDAAKAIDMALRSLTPAAGTRLGEPSLVVFIEGHTRPHLAWKQWIGYTDGDGEPQEDEIYASAVDGRLLKNRTLIWTAKDRKIHDGTGICLNTNASLSQLPGTFLWGEGGPFASDTAALYAYNGTGRTWDYYKHMLGRDSYDGSGGSLVSTVHVTFNNNCSPNNAAWIQSKQQMVYGDGDGQTFAVLSKDNDVTAHELTHGVTADTAGLVYEKEPGALNEAMSDILGETVDSFSTCPGWKIGEDVYTPGTAGDALRYMYDPSLDGKSPDYYPDVAATIAACSPTWGNDWCNVHTNSGIPNLAFKLLAAGGSHPKGKTSVVVPATGIETAARIFYRALRYHMTSTTTFPEARQATAYVAQTLASCAPTLNAGLADAVHKAWEAVGVPLPPQQFWTLQASGDPGDVAVNPCVYYWTPKGLQLIKNPGFTSGAQFVWKPSRGTAITDSPSLPAHGGTWKAWLGGNGTATTESLYQQTSIPSAATTATLSFWLLVDSSDSASVANDTFQVQLRSCSGSLLATLDTLSNVDETSGYVYKSYDVTAYKGQPVRVHFRSTENASLATSFLIDDVSLLVK